jgi:hypothetical protein
MVTTPTVCRHCIACIVIWSVQDSSPTLKNMLLNLVLRLKKSKKYGQAAAFVKFCALPVPAQYDKPSKYLARGNRHIKG